MSSVVSSTASKLAMQLNDADAGMVMDIAAEICCGCRCGWLCCECDRGCASCKERRWRCFCHQNVVYGIFQRCMFCEWLLNYCECWRLRKCKWCVVSLAKCKRGGCILKLPERLSAGAQPYVEIFNREDGPDDDEVSVAGGVDEDDASFSGSSRSSMQDLPGLKSPTDSLSSDDSAGSQSGSEISIPIMEEETKVIKVKVIVHVSKN